MQVFRLFGTIKTTHMYFIDNFQDVGCFDMSRSKSFKYRETFQVATYIWVYGGHVILF